MTPWLSSLRDTGCVGTDTCTNGHHTPGVLRTTGECSPSERTTMEQFKKKLPVDIQSFETMQTEHCLYVDKTRYIHRMVTEGKFYFLSRPRRFGKSLLISTLTCLFHGRKELFEGLWIAEHGEWNWNHHPAIVLDFNRSPGSSPEELKQGLLFHLAKTTQGYEVTLDAPLLELQFDELILKLYDTTGMPVVVLILVEAQCRVLTSHFDKLRTGKGRIDLAVFFPEKIYIIEFKYYQSAETALRQIRDKHYAEKYRRSGKKIILMGINFNQQKRSPEEWKIQYDNDWDHP
ncbi:MAG: AAA family ATPase [bacterium]|nr:AAA family ATPase [bacterium]